MQDFMMFIFSATVVWLVGAKSLYTDGMQNLHRLRFHCVCENIIVMIVSSNNDYMTMEKNYVFAIPKQKLSTNLTHVSCNVSLILF